MEVSRFDILDEVMADVKLRMLLWESMDTWAKTLQEWYTSDFNSLNTEDMNMFTAKNVKNINQLEKGLPPNLIVPKLKEEVEMLKDKVYIFTIKILKTKSINILQLPTIQYLRNPSLKQRHWMKIENLLGHKFKADEVVTLQMLESLQVFNYPAQLLEISGQASSEAALESLLKKVCLI